jgi:hypothetical protein
MQGGYVTVCCREYGDYLTFERIAEKALIIVRPQNLSGQKGEI